MSRLVVKCPVCEHQESVISTSPNAELPPCPRCEDFIRMKDITPQPGQTKTWSTAGSQTADGAPAAADAPPSPPPTPVKRRDMRDFGPEPRN